MSHTAAVLALSLPPSASWTTSVATTEVGIAGSPDSLAQRIAAVATSLRQDVEGKVQSILAQVRETKNMNRLGDSKGSGR
jgi:hypothetical protein